MNSSRSADSQDSPAGTVSSSWHGRHVGEALAMTRAIELARNGMHAGLGGPFGAIVVRDGVIVGEGENRVTSTNDPTAHAEITAIRDACSRLGTFSLDRCTVVSSCQPCPMCLAAILWSRATVLVYGASGKDAAAAGFDDLNFHEQVGMGRALGRLETRRVGINEAAALFREWMTKSDRQAY
jgi:tRNA(Arg) A34 adenosine deaminase TadA